MSVIIPPLRAIILDYAAEWRLLHWIHFNEISWRELGGNPHPAALELMLAHPDKANWKKMNKHAHAWPYLREHPECIDLEYLGENTHPEAVAYFIAHVDESEDDLELFSANPTAIDWLCDHPTAVNLEGISENPLGDRFLRDHSGYIDWDRIHANPAPWAIAMVEANPDKYRGSLSSHSAGLDILLRRAKEQDVDPARLCTSGGISSNPDPRAVAMAISNPSLMLHAFFAENPSAIDYLGSHKNKINWEYLFANPAIFEAKWPGGFEGVLAKVVW